MKNNNPSILRRVLTCYLHSLCVFLLVGCLAATYTYADGGHGGGNGHHHGPGGSN